MILDQKKTTIGYRCPDCASGIVSMVGAFMLSADMMKLKCPCGGSVLTITYTPDKKVRLDVPCPICGKCHNYVVSKELFFSKDIFMFNCAYTGMDICFVGKEELVRGELERTERELVSILEEAGLSSLSDLRPHNEDMLPDVQIYDIVRFLVRELEADGDIECGCAAGEGEYDFELMDSAIRVYCKKCGRDHIFPADSVAAAQDFINCPHLTLTESEFS